MSIGTRSGLLAEAADGAEETADEIAQGAVSNAVLVARVGVGEKARVIRHGPVELNTQTFVASVDGQRVNLTKVEFDLLEYLIRHRDRVVAPNEIARELFANRSSDCCHLIRVHICNLRRAIGDAASIVITVRGRGYRVLS